MSKTSTLEITLRAKPHHIHAVAGKIMLMPGLPEKPMLEEMDLSDEGEAKGLF